MGYVTPTLPELIASVGSDIETNLPGATTKIERTPLYALAMANAGLAYGLYDFGQWVLKQTNVLTCEGDTLDKWGAIWGVTRKQASGASGFATFTGTSGTVIPTGTRISTFDGKTYVTRINGTILGGTVNIAVKSDKIGSQYNAPAGTVLSLVNPTLGINSDAISLDISGAVDIEADEPYRNRILDRISGGSNGANAGYYVQKTLEVPGVTRAWVTSGELGSQSVNVRFMMDDLYSDGIPLSSNITTVNNYLQPLKALNTYLTVSAPAIFPANLNFLSITPDTPAIRSAVDAELRVLFKTVAAPGQTVYLTQIINAIFLADGVVNFQLDPSRSMSDIVVSPDMIVTLGVTLWP